MPVQKQTRAGQRTRFKAFVAIGDFDGHVGLGVKCAKEVATAIRGAIIVAKLSVIPVRRGYWGNKLGEPHTVPCKVQGKAGSVYVKLVPAPRGTGIVAAPASKRMLQLAGVEDCYTQSRGNTSTCVPPSLLPLVAVAVVLVEIRPLTLPFSRSQHGQLHQGVVRRHHRHLRLPHPGPLDQDRGASLSLLALAPLLPIPSLTRFPSPRASQPSPSPFEEFSAHLQLSAKKVY